MKYLYVSIIFLIVTSCRKIIDEQIADHYKPQIIFGSIINPDSAFTFLVSHTQSILDTSLPSIDNTRLVLSYGSESDTFFFGGSGGGNLHRIHGFYPKPDVTYNIILDVPGYATAFASEVIPPIRFTVDSAYQQSRATQDDQQSLDVPMNEITVSIRDDVQSRDFYELILYTRRPDGEIYSVFTAANCTTEDPILKAESDLDFLPPAFYFSDALFNGMTHNFKFRAPLGVSFIDGQAEEVAPTYLIVRSVSENYFNYRKSRTRHFFNQTRLDDPDDWLRIVFNGEPTEIYHNINNGVGIFAGYSQTEIRIEFKR